MEVQIFKMLQKALKINDNFRCSGKLGNAIKIGQPLDLNYHIIVTLKTKKKQSRCNKANIEKWMGFSCYCLKPEKL